jgi:hypothetical protein
VDVSNRPFLSKELKPRFLTASLKQGPDRMPDESGSVVAHQQSSQRFETVFPIEGISEIARLCVGLALDVEAVVYTRWTAL